jgi:energy-coupling factor transporter ATP-binding protein EcfA2
MDMPTYHVTRSSDPWPSYRCQRAADSLDIDLTKKLRHDLSVTVDLETPWSLGVIVGASGSGKSTLAEEMFGTQSLVSILDPTRPVLEQFPERMSYEDCSAALVGVGLTAVPCWIRPASTLSNGQRARAEAALQIARGGRSVIDEWTSVVDRTVAKVMSHCVQKHARRTPDARVVLVSCHYDVLDWINPDWVIDCNNQTVTDRRSLWRSHQRRDALEFAVYPCDGTAWRMFARYHYLSDRLPGGSACYGLWHGADQIGFCAASIYVPPRKSMPTLRHLNRLVIHPDYAGLGLGLPFSTTVAGDRVRLGERVAVTFSARPMGKALARDANWRALPKERRIGRKHNARLGGQQAASTRYNVTLYRYEYVGGPLTDTKIAQK